MKGTNSIKIETPFEGDDTVYYINGGRTSGKVNKLVDDMIKLINDLKQENQQLKIQISAREEEYKKLEDNWSELKEWLKKELGDRINPNKDKWLTGVYDAYKETIDKMQEIERSDSNE